MEIKKANTNEVNTDRRAELTTTQQNVSRRDLVLVKSRFNTEKNNKLYLVTFAESNNLWIQCISIIPKKVYNENNVNPLNLSPETINVDGFENGGFVNVFTGAATIHKASIVDKIGRIDEQTYMGIIESLMSSLIGNYYVIPNKGFSYAVKPLKLNFSINLSLKEAFDFSCINVKDNGEIKTATEYKKSDGKQNPERKSADDGWHEPPVDNEVIDVNLIVKLFEKESDVDNGNLLPLYATFIKYAGDVDYANEVYINIDNFILALNPKTEVVSITSEEDVDISEVIDICCQIYDAIKPVNE